MSGESSQDLTGKCPDSSCQDDDSGIYTFSYTRTVAGTYFLTLGLNGITVPTPHAPQNVTVFPAALDVSTSFAYGDSLVSAVAGVNGLFYIKLRDQYHNVLRHGQPGHPSSRNVAVTYTVDARMTWPNGGMYARISLKGSPPAQEFTSTMLTVWNKDCAEYYDFFCWSF